MICSKHNLFVRVGHCQCCVQEIEEELQLQHEIRMLEKELKEPIQLWP